MSMNVRNKSRCDDRLHLNIEKKYKNITQSRSAILNIDLSHIFELVNADLTSKAEFSAYLGRKLLLTDINKNSCTSLTQVI